MPVLNLYVTDKMNSLIRSKAKKEGKSISALALELLQNELMKSEWSKEFTAAFGALPDFPEVEKLPMQKRKKL